MLAADTTINTAETTTQGPTTPPLNGGDTLTIGPTGSVTVTGDDIGGISARGGSNTITNSGSISTSGLFGDGISARGGSNTITNSGSISTSGEESYGIWATGGSNTITNSGSISTSEVKGDGINATGDSNTITNSGSISTSGNNGYGISAFGSSNTITNSGSISTSGNNGYGIFATGTSNTITNSGSIATSGETAPAVLGFLNSSTFINSGSIKVSGGSNAYGVYAQGQSNTISNSGSISTTGNNSIGLYVDGDSNQITNSGSISSTGSSSGGVYVSGNSNTLTNSGSIVSAYGYAVYFDGSSNVFSSQNNFLAGKINMGSGGTVNIATGANYSKLYTFEGSSLKINGSGTIPLFINDTTQQAGTYDPTIFASSSDALADMTSAISSLTPGRFNGTDKEHPIWARGFGTTSSYSGTYSGADTTLDRNYIFSGVALGYDAIRSKDLVVGLLGGYGQTSITADAESTQSFNNTSDGGFLGLYGQKRWKEWAFDFALYGGVQSFQQQRYVNDNLAYLGNSSTQASFQGWWIAPELAATVKLAEVNGWSLLPTAKLRYAQQWMGGYTETGGGAANASVSGRNVTIGQSFVGVGTRKTIKTKLGKNTKMVLDGQVGYMYRGAVGDDTVDVTMIGQSLSLPTEISSRNAVAVSAGVALDLSSAVTLKIRGDAAAGGGMNYVGGGWAGLSFKF